MPEIRQLAVIMFTDIVGYTAMMQHDEAQALTKLNSFKEKLNEHVQELCGKIIQYYGDGALVIFTNSTDAVNCARILQESFRDEPQVPVRIGIHLGDIINKEGNIFGNCVNITSRIESMGVPGAVLLSGHVQKQLKNQPEYKLTSLGDFEFKNVEEPIEIFALALEGFPVPHRDELNGKFKESTIRSIAVLPFVNMSNDPEQEYFGDGMAEEIINSLTHLEDLNVAGRTSSFQFKGKNFDLRQIGRKLGVDTVLEGSVRKQGDRLRITVQLVNVKDGYHLWSERYDRQINDVFAIQDEIALAITEKLSLTLLKKDRDLLTKSYTQNAEAYELYLKGRFYLARRGSSLITSIQCFQKAIEIDPGFALAHSSYADANMLLATYGLLPPKRAMIRAKRSAEKALQLAPSLSQPYCSLGYYYSCYEWKWPEAKKNFLRAIKMNSRNAEGYFRYAWNYLTCVEGRFDEAEEYAKKAISLEPLSSICYAHSGMLLQSAGKFDEALEACMTGIELDGNSFACYINAGRAQMGLGLYDDAIASFETVVKVSNRHHFIVNLLIWAYCLTDRFDKARKLMQELKERSLTEYVAGTVTAVSAAYLGDMDEAFEFLERAYNDRDPILMMLKYEHWVPLTLKEDPRYQKILERIDFPAIEVTLTS